MTSAQAVPVTVQLQDAMPRALMNTRSETRPTQYYQSWMLGQKLLKHNRILKATNHGQTIKDPKPNFTSTQRCQEWKELNNQPMNNGWFLYKLGLRLSPHTKGWSNAAHSAAKQIKPRWSCHGKLQDYFSKLCFCTDIPMRLVLSPVCSTKATD